MREINYFFRLYIGMYVLSYRKHVFSEAETAFSIELSAAFE